MLGNFLFLVNHKEKQDWKSVHPEKHSKMLFNITFEKFKVYFKDNCFFSDASIE